MMPTLPQLILIFLSILLLTSSTPATANVESVFVFGDSQFDSGNNKYVKNCTLQANFRPYGASYFHHPTGRFTNGRTVADFLAQYMGIKFQEPYQMVYRLLAKGSLKKFPSNGVNFASAGSGLLEDTNRDAKVTPIQVQLQQFRSLIAQRHIPKTQLVHSLYFIVSGANDVFSYFLLPGASKMTPKTYVNAMLKEVIHFTSKIYMYGARRIVFFSIGPMGCIPGRVLIRGAPTDKCIDKMDTMAELYNSGLKRFILRVPRLYPGAIGVYAAVYDTAKTYRDNAKQYGFKNIADACCGGGPLNGLVQCGLKGYKMCWNPNDYFFWDYFHPSERTYGLISKAFWAGNKTEIWPVNLKTLTHHNLTKPLP